MISSSVVVLANDRQLHRGLHILGLFLVVWGGMFGGIPLAMLLSASGPRGGGSAVLVLFPVIGFPAFFAGLYLVLARKEVRLDTLRALIEERSSFLGSATVVTHARRLFDRVVLSVETGPKGTKSYTLALQGTGPAIVSLGDFMERNEALTAGMRAARDARVAFEEKRESGPALRLAPAELARVPAAQSPEERPWWRRPSAVALVAANLVPVLGVLFWGWHILPVMLLFWMENVVIGLFTIAKMLLARGEPDESGETAPALLAYTGNLFLAIFFTFHYGMFCAVHGIFVVTMFGRDELGASRNFDLPDLPNIALDLVLGHGLLWALFALVASHGVSFYMHYLRPRAYEDASAGKIMAEPYKRVVILHVVILAGGFAATVIGASAGPLLLLIALKIFVDLNSHRREHAVPFERELRDYMSEHGHQYLRADEPASPAESPVQRADAAPASVADRNDRPLAHYLGAWRAGPEAAVPAGWIARAEIRDAGGKVKLRLWSQAGKGLADEGEFAPVLRGGAARVEFLEVRQQAGGRMRIARFTGSDAGANHIDLNEIQYPAGNTRAMQARSLSLQRD